MNDQSRLIRIKKRKTSNLLLRDVKVESEEEGMNGVVSLGRPGRE